jgi:seryl-tRNA(Sec) selenium transferase
MLLSYNVHEPDGQIKQAEWIEVAKRRGIPTLLDAAADAPPVEMLSHFNRVGFDLVAFSGGKALRGPQCTGLLLGSKDLIAAAKLNTSPNCGNIGRAMKVSKEDMVAMWAAVDRFVHLDHAAEWREWERRIGAIEDALRGIPTVRTERIVPPIANRVPHLLIHWDENHVRISPDGLKQRLEEGNPPIATARVHGTGTSGFLISVFMLNPGEEQIVAARVAEALSQTANA